MVVMVWSMEIVMSVMFIEMTPVSVVSIMIPIVAPVAVVSIMSPSVAPVSVMVIVSPSVAPVAMVVIMSPSVMVIMSPSVMVIVSPSVMVIMSPSIMVVMVVPITVDIVVVSVVISVMISVVDIWVDNCLSVLCWFFLFLSWLWCLFLWLCFCWLFGCCSLLSVHISFVVKRNSVHLLSKENLGEGKTKRVSEFIVMLILPLSHSIHEFVVHILSINDEIVINMEDKVPWVSECLGHVLKFIEVSSNSCFALLEFSSNIVNDGSHVFNCMENAIESCVSEFIDNSSKSLPDVFSITETFNSMWDFSLNRSSKDTFENLSHSEEGEVNI